MNQPQTWHHGLVARASAEFWTDTGSETTYFKRLIETSGQPALDLGCGTGRLLLPYVQAGLDVDGVDYSKDMLDQCQHRAETAGIALRLYQQALHALDLPQRYKTIYACGVIGLGGNRRLTRQAMQRCYEHLRPGGTLAFDLTARWNDRPAYVSRLPENRHALPEDWPSSTERKLLGDGTELEIIARTVSVDPLEETQTRQLRARLWRNGELLEEQVHTQRYEEYGKNELILVLEQAGFSDIQIFGNYSDELATVEHLDLLFLAKK
jgi:SAM-dependent methyltransferase